MTDTKSGTASGIHGAPKDEIHAESLSPKERFTLQIQINQTYLAWVRTSIAMLGLGLVLAKLALWVRVMDIDLHNRLLLRIQEYMGIALLSGGTLLAIMMAVAHQQNTKSIRGGRIPEMGLMPAYLLAGIVVLVGALLTGLILLW